MARRLVCGRRAGGEETRSQLLAEPRRLQCDTHSRVRGGGKASPGDWGPERQTRRDGYRGKTSSMPWEWE